MNAGYVQVAFSHGSTEYVGSSKQAAGRVDFTHRDM